MSLRREIYLAIVHRSQRAAPPPQHHQRLPTTPHLPTTPTRDCHRLTALPTTPPSHHPGTHCAPTPSHHPTDHHPAAHHPATDHHPTDHPRSTRHSHHPTILAPPTIHRCNTFPPPHPPTIHHPTGSAYASRVLAGMPFNQPPHQGSTRRHPPARPPSGGVGPRMAETGHSAAYVSPPFDSGGRREGQQPRRKAPYWGCVAR